MYPANIIDNLNGLDTRIVVLSGFDPSDLTGLQLWLDANDASTLFQDAAKTIPAGNGDVVGAWENKANPGTNDGTQATTAAKPTLHTGVVNGLPIIRFDGTDDFLNIGDLSALTAAEIFIVVKIDNDPPALAAQSGLWSMGTDGVTPDTHFPFTTGDIFDVFGTTVRKPSIIPTIALDQWNIYNVVSISGEWTNRINTVQQHTTGTNTVGFVATAKIGISNGGTFFLDGDIAEIILYNAKLSTEDRTQLNAYLSNKYGITLP